MSAAAGEPRRLRMVGARQRAIANTVPVHVFVTGKAAQPVEVFLRQHFPTIDRFFRILERFRHPVVHAEVEVRHHEHRRLQLLGQIERLTRHRETFRHRTRQQHGMDGIAVRELGHKLNVTLRGAGWQSGGRPHALHVPDHARNFHVVSQPRKLRHQRNSRSGRGRHRTCSCPSGTQTPCR